MERSQSSRVLLPRVIAIILGTALVNGVWCGLSSSDPAASCLGASNCGYQNRAIWIQPGDGQPVFQVYCGSGGQTLAMLINGADPNTFAYSSPYWTTGWWAGVSLASDPTQYSTYAASFTNAIFQSYNTLSASSFTMSIAGATPVTIPINFSSLRSLFSGPTQTTSLHISQWKSFVSYVNLPSYYVGCQIQGINIASCANPNPSAAEWCCQMRVGIMLDETGYNVRCLYIGAAIGIGGWSWYGGYYSIVGGGGSGEYAGTTGAYVHVWIPGAPPPACCQAGYYCPSLWGGTTQFVCPAVRLMGSGYYCPACSVTYADKPCLYLYWGPAGSTVPTCGGLCEDQPACPTQTRTASQTPSVTRSQTQSATPSQTQTSTCCREGYYCPKPGPVGPFGDGFQPVTAQYLCPAGFYCPPCSSDYSGTPCQAGYWGRPGQTSPLCDGLCQDVPGCPSDSRTPSQTSTPPRTPTSTASLTPSLTISSSRSLSPSSSGTRSSDPSPSQSQSSSATATSSNSATCSQSATLSLTQTETSSLTVTMTPSESVSPSSTMSSAQTKSQSRSLTPPGTPSRTPSASQRATNSQSGSQTVSRSATRLGSPSSSATPTGSQLATLSPTETPSETQSSSLSGSPSPSTTNSTTILFIAAALVTQTATAPPLSHAALVSIGFVVAVLAAVCLLVAYRLRRKRKGGKAPLASSSSLEGTSGGDSGFTHDNPLGRNASTQSSTPSKVTPRRMSNINPHLAIPVAAAPDGFVAQGKRALRKSVMSVSMPKRTVGRAPSTRGRPTLADLPLPPPPLDCAPAAAGSGAAHPVDTEGPPPSHDVAVVSQEESAASHADDAQKPSEECAAAAAGTAVEAPGVSSPEHKGVRPVIRRDAPLPASRVLLLRGAMPSERIETETVKLRPVNRKSITLQRREQATFTAVTRRVIDFVEESAGKMWSLPAAQAAAPGSSVHAAGAGSGMDLTAGPSAALWMRKPAGLPGLKRT